MQCMLSWTIGYEALPCEEQYFRNTPQLWFGHPYYITDCSSLLCFATALSLPEDFKRAIIQNFRSVSTNSLLLHPRAISPPSSYERVCRSADYFQPCPPPCLLYLNQTMFKTSLLRRVQTQTLPDATPPIGKTHPFSKIAITFEPVMRLGALGDLESPKNCNIVYFMTKSPIFNHEEVVAA